MKTIKSIFKWVGYTLIVFELWLQLFAIPLMPLTCHSKEEQEKCFKFFTSFSIGHWILHIY